MFIATLIAAGRLSSGDISAAEDALAAADVQPAGRSWLETDTACDLLFQARPAEARAILEGLLPGVDIVVQGEANRRKSLLVADMDSTMITIECIDELADYAGLKAEVADVTERAMRGELAFEEALDARVALLEGLSETMIDLCHAERLSIMPGAKALVATMRAHGATCLLVSGGFTRFADRVAADIGFDRAIANRLNIADGRLLGTVERPIVGAQAKLDALTETAAELGLGMDAVLAVGDGANDIPMLEVAGLGVAYRAKPKTQAAADARIDHSDLSALLYAQGYMRRDWCATDQ
ncbi:phosphoserine phosphatase SerB [Allosphingosinicella flava]|uniref:Phosphoserine phosphatase n=1 Tax=Allosphingosinicella flava TaxID=2771430 RepID=A0A7T2GKM4_9SPHN|nr:phosphoserine phosphatase SerB [Sphingosinicella flava]QPQ55532.1 phosphoserine phosphatase SerB [Sphingosinicella flava]